MESPENGKDVLTFLDEGLFPRHCGDKLPDLIMYDRACIVTRSFKDGNSQMQFAERWFNGERSPGWRVDRFHFFSHSALDEHCR